ncbi:MAG TPA: BMP family ABC transporter substrate-binding protein [Chloroflexota bacterium]|jgi:basic membrane protein A|nr:BMP family ABC transporter substrate-binding protein [Chloroflexota bacterium]
MTRRLTSPLSVFLALVLLLAACAPAATPTAAPKPTDAPKPAQAPKPAEAAAPTKPAEPTKPAAVVTPPPAKPATTPPLTPAAAATKPAATAATATPTFAAKPGQAIKVGLVTDVGKIDDKSFNQSAWAGVQRAQKELGADVKFVETTDPKDYAKNIDQFAQANYDVIVTVGFAIGQATAEAAKKYPKVKFIGVDQFQEKETENLAGLIFPEDKAGYLAGYLAGSMSKSGVVGQVLGTPIVPPVEAFGVGYIAGAKAAKPDLKVLSACHPGGLAKGFTDPDWGKSTALQMIDQKADVVFAAGGQTGNGGLIAAAERKVLAIGVDTDQYFTLPEAKAVLLSSAMKLITPGVFNLVKSAQDGAFKGGNVVGEVGLAPFHDVEAQVPAAVKNKLPEIDTGLKENAIKTGWGKPTGNCPQG